MRMCILVHMYAYAYVCMYTYMCICCSGCCVHFRTGVPGTSACAPVKKQKKICQKNPIFTNLKKRFEHIQLPAKLLEYFLRSNKSNINPCVIQILLWQQRTHLQHIRCRLCTYVCMHIHVYMHAYVFGCVCACMILFDTSRCCCWDFLSVYRCACTCMCICVCMYACICTYTHVCICIYVCLCICIHIHLYVHACGCTYARV